MTTAASASGQLFSQARWGLLCKDDYMAKKLRTPIVGKENCGRFPKENRDTGKVPFQHPNFLVELAALVICSFFDTKTTLGESLEFIGKGKKKTIIL